MANKNLMVANQAMVDANSYDAGTDIANQLGKVMAAQEVFSAQLNEDAMEASEDLSADAIGVDLMSDEAREWTTTEFDRLGTEIATARANGDKKKVRELEMEGANLISMQGQIGNLLKDHAENKLSNNYSKSADQDMLNMLITKKYTIGKDSDGKYRVFFSQDENLHLTEDKSSSWNQTMPFGVPNQKELWQKKYDKAEADGDENEMKKLRLEKERLSGKGHSRDWQKEGVLLSDLDKHIRVKDDGQADVFNEQLGKIAKNSNDNKNYNIVQNETQRIITETTDTTDKLQTALFDNAFSQDNKTLAEIYAEENNLSKKDAFAMLRSSGSEYKKNEEKIREWTNNKLTLAAENHHNQNSPSYGEMTDVEKRNQATVQSIDTFFETIDMQGGEVYSNDLNKLNNANTKFVIENFEFDMGNGQKQTNPAIIVKKWVNGAWVQKNEYPRDKLMQDRETLRQILAEELGMQSSQNYSSNIIQR